MKPQIYFINAYNQPNNNQHNKRKNTMKESLKIREEWRNLNIQINSQLKRAGKPLNELPESEWKNWITELIKYRDSLTPKVV